MNLPRDAEDGRRRATRTSAAGQVALLTSPDGGALVRVIAGEVDGHAGPGSTHTPITLVHATLAPGATLELPWRPDFNALVYVLAGAGTVGADGARPHGPARRVRPRRPDHRRGASPGPAPRRSTCSSSAARRSASRSPYGPFVMNTRQEVQAFEDFQAGRLGTIPARTSHGAVRGETGQDDA